MDLSEGIIIKTINYKESSKIIYLVTKLGLESLEVRGANKINGHSHIYANLLTKIAYSESKHFLSSGKVLNSYVNIKGNTKKLNVCLQILEFCYSLAEHINDRETFYNFLEEILSLIDEKENFEYYEVIFYIKTLYLLGIAPLLNRCVSCTSKEGLLGFVFARGGMICEKCYKTYDSLYDSKVIVDVIRLYYTKLAVLKENELSLDYNLLRQFYERYYKEYIGYESKSKKILDKIL